MGRAPSIVQQSHKSDWYSFSYSVCHCLKVATGACHLFLSATLLTTSLIALAGRPATVSARSLKCSALAKFGSEFGRCPTIIIQICDITLSMSMAVFCWNYCVVDLHECKFVMRLHNNVVSLVYLLSPTCYTINLCIPSTQWVSWLLEWYICT